MNATDLMAGDVVAYDHPEWGPVRGRVIRVEPNDQKDGRIEALCQDLSPNGAREWWPVAELRAVGGAS